MTSEAVKRRQHIRPRNASNDEAVCVLSGLMGVAEGTRTATAAAEIECSACRVGADLMLEAGDLFVSDEGRWMLDERPAEYRSLYSFIEYLTDDERRTFTQEELQELVLHTNASYREMLSELRRLDFKMIRPPREPEVRGIGRLKRPTGAEG